MVSFTHTTVFVFSFPVFFPFYGRCALNGTTFVSVQKHKKRRHCFKITQIFILINSTAMYVLFHLYKKKYSSHLKGNGIVYSRGK